MSATSVKSKVPDNYRKQAISATQVKHGHEEHEKESTAMCFVFMTALKACAQKKDVCQVRRIHAKICNSGLLYKDIYLGNALVSLYAKCGALAKARKLLYELPIRNVVTWNALIAGYAQHGCGKEALGCFEQMLSEGLSLDAITYACALKACGIAQDLDMGERIHHEIVTQGLLQNHVLLGNALIDMYARFGILTKARKVLLELRVRNAVSWNTLIARYAQYGCGKEALGCFQQMLNEGLFPNEITYACSLKACGIVQDVDMGKKIHEEIATQGLLQKHVLLGGALVDMYVKCGVLTKAQKVLHELPVRTIVTWNALIAGYAQHGCGREAMGCFHRMRSEGLSPNEASWNSLLGGYAQQGLAEQALDCFRWMQQEGTSPSATTLASVLKACSHSGLVNEGQMLFKSMREKYGITPNEEHYTCMVDLFGRARLFNEAIGVIKMMPSSDSPSVWRALLGACRTWGNVELGRLAFECVVELDKWDVAAYVDMTNTFRAAGMEAEAQDIERMRIRNGAREQPGCSCWTDASQMVHRFVVGDSSHPQSRQISL